MADEYGRSDLAALAKPSGGSERPGIAVISYLTIPRILTRAIDLRLRRLRSGRRGRRCFRVRRDGGVRDRLRIGDV